MALKLTLSKERICDGRELKPKYGSNFSNTWVFDGKEIKPKSGANNSNTYDIERHSILLIAAFIVLRLW